MSKRNRVELIKQEEPKFIRKFKRTVGYVEPSKLEDKVQVGCRSDDQHRDDGYVHDDELPVVLLDNETFMNPEDTRELFSDKKIVKEVKPIFKKPKKNTENHQKKAGIRKKNKLPPVKNTALISFKEEDDNDDNLLSERTEVEKEPLFFNKDNETTKETQNDLK